MTEVFKYCLTFKHIGVFMKLVLLLTLLAFSMNAFSGNSRIRYGKTCKKQTKTELNQSIEI